MKEVDLMSPTRWPGVLKEPRFPALPPPPPNTLRKAVGLARADSLARLKAAGFLAEEGAREPSPMIYLPANY